MYHSVPWLTVASKINDFNLHSKNVLISHNRRNKAKETNTEVINHNNFVIEVTK